MGKGAPKVSAKGHWKLGKTVVLVGMMGAGKTAVGKALADFRALPVAEFLEKYEG